MKFKVKGKDEKREDVIKFYLKEMGDGSIQIRALEDSSMTKYDWSIGWLTPTGLTLDSGISTTVMPVSGGRFIVKGYSPVSRY